LVVDSRHEEGLKMKTADRPEYKMVAVAISELLKQRS
jgi:hypothetical protein